MNAEMQTQLDRVEQALNALVESITSYNPSVIAANQLLEADEALSGSLERLTQHQASVAKLKQLRESAAGLDERIKTNIGLLADTRTELVKNTPVTLPQAPVRTVESEELLSYAQRIARFTIAPTARPQMANDAAEVAPNEAKAEEKNTGANGLASEAASPQADGTRTSAAGASAGQSRLLDKLSDPVKAVLRPEAVPGTVPFQPWPSPEVIKLGFLGRIQLAKESGVPPDRPAVDNPAPESTLAASAATASQPAQVTKRAPAAATGGPVSKPVAAPRQPAKQDDDEAFDDFNLYNPDD